MSFLDLQNRLVQTRKARRGVSNRRDYYEEDESNNLEFDNAVYRKALSVANKVVQHYTDLGQIEPMEQISINFGKNANLENLKKENKRLLSEVESIKEELAEFRGRFHRGGRKGYDATMAEQIRNARANGETWRGLSAKLGISPTTAQKLYKTLCD